MALAAAVTFRARSGRVVGAACRGTRSARRGLIACVPGQEDAGRRLGGRRHRSAVLDGRPGAKRPIPGPADALACARDGHLDLLRVPPEAVLTESSLIGDR